MALHPVKNLREGSREGNWLLRWKRANGFTDGAEIQCHWFGCFKNAVDGGHIILDGPNTTNRWYIVPLCHEHNCQHGAKFIAMGPLVHVFDDEVIP